MGKVEGNKENHRDLGKILETLTSNDIIGTLANIADLGETLEAGRQNYSPEEAGSLIKIQSERAARLINAMLITQQIQSGERTVNVRSLTLRPALEDVIINLAPTSERYATRVKLSRKKKLRPVLVDDTLLPFTLRSALEAVIRTTVSKKITVDTVSHDDRLFIHIIDRDASYESPDDGASRSTAGSAHAIAIPSFYIAGELIRAMGGELRIAASKEKRHIDLIFPHSVQLSMGL